MALFIGVNSKKKYKALGYKACLEIFYKKKKLKGKILFWSLNFTKNLFFVPKFCKEFFKEFLK